MNQRARIALAPFHSFHLPVSADRLVSIQSPEDIPPLIAMHRAGEPYFLVGEGSNSVFLEDIPATAVRIQLNGRVLMPHSMDKVMIRAGAGEVWRDLAWWASEQGYWGMENLVDIPGLVGACPIQNIGAYGVEVSQLIDSVEGVNLATGEEIHLKTEVCGFAYRHSVFKTPLYRNTLITAVNFCLSTVPHPHTDYPDLAGLRDQPLRHPLTVAQTVREIRAKKLPAPHLQGNAGSFFKNPLVSHDQVLALIERHPTMPHYPHSDGRHKLSAAWLIDHCGLKGFRIGAVGVSAQHALVLVHHHLANLSPNIKKSAPADLSRLIKHLENTISQRFGILLEPEPVIYSSLSPFGKN